MAKKKIKKQKPVETEFRRRVAHNFRRLRDDRNLNQAQLAELAGKSQDYISQIENMWSGLTDTQEFWAEIFGVDMLEFLRPIQSVTISDTKAADGNGNYEIALRRESLSKGEEELLNLYRGMGKRDKRQLLAIARSIKI